MILSSGWQNEPLQIMKSPRPRSVNAAIACLIVSYLIPKVEHIRYLNLSDWGNVISVIAVFLVECAIVLGIYFRKNWVRWLIVATTANWFAHLIWYRFSEQAGDHGVRLIYFALILAFSVAAAVFLFYPESNDWFRKQPQPRPTTGLSDNPKIQQSGEF
jgi:hypothetical protein